MLRDAAALRVAVGAPLPLAERGDVERVEQALRAALGDDVVQSEMRRAAHNGVANPDAIVVAALAHLA